MHSSVAALTNSICPDWLTQVKQKVNHKRWLPKTRSLHNRQNTWPEVNSMKPILRSFFFGVPAVGRYVLPHAWCCLHSLGGCRQPPRGSTQERLIGLICLTVIDDIAVRQQLDAVAKGRLNHNSKQPQRQRQRRPQQHLRDGVERQGSMWTSGQHTTASMASRRRSAHLGSACTWVGVTSSMLIQNSVPADRRNRAEQAR